MAPGKRWLNSLTQGQQPCQERPGTRSEDKQPGSFLPSQSVHILGLGANIGRLVSVARSAVQSRGSHARRVVRASFCDLMEQSAHREVEAHDQREPPRWGHELLPPMSYRSRVGSAPVPPVPVRPRPSPGCRLARRPGSTPAG